MPWRHGDCDRVRPLTGARLPSLPSGAAFPLVPGLPAAPAALPTGATGGAKVQTGLLQSLQRRFVQQALQTPAVTAGKQQQQAEEEEEEEEGDEEGLGGFVLHSQPTYERCLSQRHSEQGGDVLHPSGSAEDTQTHFDLGAGPSRLGSVQGQEVVEEARQHQAPAGGVLDPEELRQQLSGASHASHHTTTPGLSSSERAAALAASGLGSTSKLFPIFRSRRDMKQLYIVRHGESEYNAESAKATSQGGKWADPWIFDAPLTERGRQQARDLRTQLAKLVLPADTLWVTSPLQRAIQTLLLCCPVAHRLRSGDCSGGVENAGPSNGAASSLPPPMVCVRQEISERVFTTGEAVIHSTILRMWHPCWPGASADASADARAELNARPEAWPAQPSSADLLPLAWPVSSQVTSATRPTSCASTSRSWLRSWSGCRRSGGTAGRAGSTARWSRSLSCMSPRRM